jgi:hypothetical protein
MVAGDREIGRQPADQPIEIAQPTEDRDRRDQSAGLVAERGFDVANLLGVEAKLVEHSGRGSGRAPPEVPGRFGAHLPLVVFQENHPGILPVAEAEGKPGGLTEGASDGEQGVAGGATAQGPPGSGQETGPSAIEVAEPSRQAVAFEAGGPDQGVEDLPFDIVVPERTGCPDQGRHGRGARRLRELEAPFREAQGGG